ncbi:uncharacterized protein F4822DRAFT_201997 [Hypoxylon trugodes]|uniref:uncharacterized protein n=1 Tax=Hypoxylon trugodes TaxID=326681 RepID=UPI0021A0AB2C|nr:uncharacterized protein F4822DRAFT_201997 [Hypoxylon trugodes]KAI1389466.1 hypothetical protein F4822DRAFT_201997 [Hypoxylon trugodes]
MYLLYLAVPTVYILPTCTAQILRYLGTLILEGQTEERKKERKKKIFEEPQYQHFIHFYINHITISINHHRICCPCGYSNLGLPTDNIIITIITGAEKGKDRALILFFLLHTSIPFSLSPNL